MNAANAGRPCGPFVRQVLSGPAPARPRRAWAELAQRRRFRSFGLGLPVLPACRSFASQMARVRAGQKFAAFPQLGFMVDQNS